MLWQLKVDLKKKLVIGLVLSSGLFVIAAAIVRVVVTLGDAPSGTTINLWGVRETVLGVFTVNVPILRPLFTRRFWRRGPFVPSGVSSSGNDISAGSRGNWRGTFMADICRNNNEDIELHSSGVHRTYHIGVPGGSSSQEEMIRADRAKEGNVVIVHSTIDVEHTDREESSSFSEEKRSHVWSNIGSRR